MSTMEFSKTQNNTIKSQFINSISTIRNASQAGNSPSSTYVLDEEIMLPEVGHMLAALGFYVKITRPTYLFDPKHCNYVSWNSIFPIGKCELESKTEAPNNTVLHPICTQFVEVLETLKKEFERDSSHTTISFKKGSLLPEVTFLLKYVGYIVETSKKKVVVKKTKK